MNQEYRERVKRHREAGGDEKYVNVKKKATARHEALKESHLEKLLKKPEYKKANKHFDAKGYREMMQ